VRSVLSGPLDGGVHTPLAGVSSTGTANSSSGGGGSECSRTPATPGTPPNDKADVVHVSCCAFV
jgi:hypothetical protein